MPHRTFLAFIAPSLFVMLLFIALPIVSIAYQSLFVEHEQIVTTVENCGPFGCETETRVDADAMQKIREEQRQLDRLKHQEEDKRSEVVAARQDTSSLEKLREKKLEGYRKEVQKGEEAMIDELVSTARVMALSRRLGSLRESCFPKSRRLK